MVLTIFTAKIDVTKDNVSIRGNGNATILKRNV